MNGPGENLPVAGAPPGLPRLFDARLPDSAAGGQEADLRAYANMLVDSRWLIATITMLAAFAALLYALVALPVFEANLVIHVEEESPNASKNILSEASSLFETKKAAIAEMELLRSRMVVARAVDNLQLFIDARPSYFPLVGFWFARRANGALSTPGLFGHGGWVWGSERADVAQFDVPERWFNHAFTLTALGEGRYRLSGGAGAGVDGVVGELLHARVADGPIALRVTRLDGRAGARFMLRRNTRLATIEAIQASMAITEQGKQSGVIAVKLQGQDPRRIYNVLSEVGREYMRQNLARKTEEAEKSLAFLNEQLPILKRQLDQSEDRYNGFRNSHGSIDTQEEARVSLQQASAARSRQLELAQKRSELLSRFTDNHPLLRGLARQRQEVDAEIADVARRIKALPALEQEESRLMRDIKVNADLYAALSTTAQQLRLIAVGRVSNVRLIDAPMAPERPIRPNRPLIVALSTLTGLFVGVLVAFARKAIRGGIDDAHAIEAMLGARVVYANIPHSGAQERLKRRARAPSAPLPLLAQASPEDGAIESLRGFRAALVYAMPHYRNNIVMLTGPTRALGRSFVAANFAAVMAASGQRVLLIDADMRNGQLHRYFGVSREQGLSKVILGSMALEHVIHRQVLDHLDFIPTGALPPNRAEFLLHLNFGSLLANVSGSYDLVLVDAPPVLGVADALVIGAHAGAVFLVARSGVTTEQEIGESIKRLNQAGIAPQGVLFNDRVPRLGDAGQFTQADARLPAPAGL
jgi:tyrosine-protein kinase Etk/Wzc